MRLLVDANLSPRVVVALIAAGYQARHVRDVGLLSAADPEIFDYVSAHRHVLVTADTDFGMLLALRRSATPSVILLRAVAELTPDEHAALLAANLPNVAEELEQGAIVSLSPDRVASAPAADEMTHRRDCGSR